MMPRDPLRADQVVPFLMSVIASGERLTEDDKADIRAALASSTQDALDVEALADAFHAKVCGPFATIDPQQCIHGRQRDVLIATAIATEYAARGQQ